MGGVRRPRLALYFELVNLAKCIFAQYQADASKHTGVPHRGAVERTVHPLRNNDDLNRGTTPAMPAQRPQFETCLLRCCGGAETSP
ncbi:hypothetical protein Trydic_g8784 [Trypoxylus dichotomus]